MLHIKSIQHIFPVFFLTLLVSCGSESSTEIATNDSGQESKTIVLTQTQFDLGKMEFGSLTKESFHRVIKANGTLDVPPENKSTVSAYFGGYVKAISLLQGQKVKKGQTLFTLENPDYIQVQQNFLEAKSQLSYLKSDYERQKELAENNVSSQKTYLKAEADYKITLAKYESLKKRLQLMNINPNKVVATNLRSTIAVTAPTSGYITSVSATKGMFLNPSDIALTIMNPDHMHVELNLFEQDLSSISEGQEVSVSIQNIDTPFEAVIYLINKAIDPENRTIKVHCHFKNEKDANALTPGMFVEAEIYASSDLSAALPINAVIGVEDKSYILTKSKSKDGNIELHRQEVQVGRSNADFVEILNADAFTDAEILVEGGFNLIGN